MMEPELSNNSVTPPYRVEKKEKMTNKPSLLSGTVQCPVCGEIDFKIHRSIDDCIAFVDFEIQRFESGNTIMIEPFYRVIVVRLRWVLNLLKSVKEGKEKIVLRTTEGMVEYQYPTKAETTLSSASNQGDNTKITE